tara:strand:- start:972 stop:2219 length:1248 start_codon:yes stop_codon:yes gene_type:complete
MKKIVFLVVNKGPAEVDWILPVIYRLSKKYFIFTYFRNKRSFISLKSNKNLFNLWKQINSNYYIESIFDNFFLKLTKKLFNILQINFLNKYFNSKIHSKKFIKKIISQKLKNENFKIKMIFSEFGKAFYALNNLKKMKNNRPLIIHYPHTPMAYKKKGGKFSSVNLETGDILLLGRKEDYDFFKHSICKTKMRVSGLPKYDKWWIKKIVSNKKNILDLNCSAKELKKKFIITIGYYSRFDVPKFKNKEHLFENQLHKLMEVVSKISNSLIIFKLHPVRNSLSFTRVLDKYDKRIWQISKMHLTNLISLSNCFINNTDSAACYDALSIKIPSIQIWRIKNIDPTNDVPSQLGFVKNVKNEIELKKIFNISKNKNHNLWKIQQKNFRKNYPYIFSTERTLKIINKELKKLNYYNNYN